MTQMAAPSYMTTTMMTAMENMEVVGRSDDFLGERGKQRKRLLLLWRREKSTKKMLSRPSKLRHQPSKQILSREAISRQKQGFKRALRAQVHCLGLVVSSTTMPGWIQVLRRMMS